jgi:hypothetical protein
VRLQIDNAVCLYLLVTEKIWVFHIIDIFVKWSAAIAIPTKKGETILECLQQTFVELGGTPKILQCDNAAEFVGEPVAGFLQRSGIEMRNSRPYHPQTNGIIERNNGIVKNALYVKIEQWQVQHPGEVLTLQQVNGTINCCLQILIMQCYLRGLLRTAMTQLSPLLACRLMSCVTDSTCRFILTVLFNLIHCSSYHDNAVAMWNRMSVEQQHEKTAANRKKALHCLEKSRNRMQVDHGHKQAAHHVKKLPVGTIVEIQDEQGSFSVPAIIVHCDQEYAAYWILSL